MLYEAAGTVGGGWVGEPDANLTVLVAPKYATVVGGDDNGLDEATAAVEPGKLAPPAPQARVLTWSPCLCRAGRPRLVISDDSGESTSLEEEEEGDLAAATAGCTPARVPASCGATDIFKARLAPTGTGASNRSTKCRTQSPSISLLVVLLVGYERWGQDSLSLPVPSSELGKRVHKEYPPGLAGIVRLRFEIQGLES